MKIRYEYVNNEVIEVEVDDALGMEIGALEMAQARKNRAETRRHASLERLMEGAVQFAADGDVVEDADAKIMAAMLRDAIAQLPLQQQRLLDQIYNQNLSAIEIARVEGIARQNVYARHGAALRNLKEIFKTSMTNPLSRG